MSQVRVLDAAVRAVAGRVDVELRGGRLRVDGQPVSMATPHLAVGSPPGEPGTESASPVGESVRGIGDGLAVLAAYSDHDLHRRLRPSDPLPRVVFDLCEQFRCESLVPAALAGVRSNLATAFDRWCRSVRGRRVGDHGVAMLVYTCAHMVRGRLISRQIGQDVDELIEATRADLARLIGHALAELPAHRDDQAAFARPAGEIARLIADMAGDAAEGALTERDRNETLALVVPTDDGDSDRDLVETESSLGAGPDPHVDPAAPAVGRRGQASELDRLDQVGGYTVFSDRYDQELEAVELYSASVLAGLRTELDLAAGTQPVGVAALARRLRSLLARPAPVGLAGGFDDGRLDRSRLAGVIVNPADLAVFSRPRAVAQLDLALTVLVDNSGSMKRHRHRNIALVVDTLARSMELAGGAVEILGHTTGAWNGGRALTDWRAAGSPTEPGRIGELSHIVYKARDQRWRDARAGIAAMLRTTHFREGIDGEAVVWAHRRLMARPASRRILIVVSDGAPTDAASMNANRPGFLRHHLAAVVDRIERFSPVEVVGLGVARDLTGIYRRSVEIDLSELPSLGDYRRILTAFTGHPA